MPQLFNEDVVDYLRRVRRSLTEADNVIRSAEADIDDLRFNRNIYVGAYQNTLVSRVIQKVREALQTASSLPVDQVSSRWAGEDRPINTRSIPQIVEYTANGNVITLDLDEGFDTISLDTTSVPDTDAFSVVRNGSEILTVDTVRVVTDSVALGVLPAIVFGDSVTMSYTPPALNPLQSGNGVSMLAVTDAFVYNLSAEPAPELSTAIVVDDLLTLTYDRPLSLAGTPAVLDYEVTIGAMPVMNPSSVNVSGNTVTLMLSTAVPYQASVSLDYSVSGTGIRNTTQVFAEAFTGQVVTNETPNPNINLVDLSYDGSFITLLYDAMVNTRSIPSPNAYTIHHTPAGSPAVPDDNPIGVTVNGTMVLLEPNSSLNAVDGDDLRLSYVQPSDNAIQNLVMVAAASFANEEVDIRI